MIFGIDTDNTEEEIINYGKCNYEIISVRRLNKKTTVDGEVQYRKTKSCVVTFKSTTLPSYITLYHNYLEVKQYIYPVIQCLNCLRFGHTTHLCRGNKRCKNCGENHDSNTCTNEKKCIYCGNNHTAVNKTCPEFERQKLIKEAMAVHKYTSYEANFIFRRQKIFFLITHFQICPIIRTK